MNIVINREVLVSALNTVNRVVSAKVSMPILTGILMDATDECITFTASNGDESIIHKLEVDNLQVTVNEQGNSVVPSSLLTIAKKLGEDIQLSFDDHQMTVQSGKSQFDLNTMDSTEYPRIPVDVKGPSLTMAFDELKNVIDKTAFAAASSETRPILQGVNFHLNGKAQISCTDSHRLAHVVKKGEFAEETQVTVPAKALQNLSKILNDGDVDIYFQDHQVVFQNDDTTYISRLLNGKYPDISRLIPTDYQTTLKFRTDAIKDTLERVSIIGKDDKDSPVKMTIQNGECILQSKGDTSKVKDQLELVELQGDEIELSFSGQYVIDALKTIDSDEVLFNFQGDMRPFTIISPESEAEIQLVLPVRTL